jgi:hypothetical protein
MNGTSAFSRYIGIDYSGAETPSSNLKGLRVYSADRVSLPSEVPPPARKYWTRRGIAEWLTGVLSEKTPTLVGIDHGFSFPLQYFQANGVPLNWAVFLDDFQRHWPTDEEHMYVDFVREGVHGEGAARSGSRKWRRITEIRCGAKSVFHFDVHGSVAKSTHSGLPWLRFIRMRTAGQVHFWPFDGWQIPAGRSAIVEVYAALWKRMFAQEGRDSHQHDAYAIAAWLRQADAEGSLASFLNPHLEEQERKIAEIEGWILGTV